MTEQSKQEHIWTNDDVEELLCGFKAALGMMDGYYSTSDAGSELRDLYDSFQQRREDLNPVVVSTIQNAKCKICGKEFTHGRHNNVFTADEQNKAVMSHVMNVHNIQDHEVRKKNVQKACVTRVTYANRNDFNRGIVQNTERKKR